MLHLPMAGGEPVDHIFRDLPSLLRPGDLLVANESRVVPARLRATRASGGAVELVLLGTGPGEVLALGGPQRRLTHGEVLRVGASGTATTGSKVTVAGVPSMVPSLGVYVRLGTGPV